MSNSAVDALMIKRDELVAEQMQSYQAFEKSIKEVETAIETLAGKKVWEIKPAEHYNDETPNYIKGTEDGI
jgi:hypothetical protein